MRISSEKLKPDIKKEILNLLFQVFADSKNVQETQALLTGVLSEAELIAVAKRIAIARYLNQGHSYTEIKKRLKISSATISEIQNQIKNSEGFQIVLEKIKTDEWADKWEKRIKDLFSRKD